MTVADLKRRLTVGTELTLIHTLMGPSNKRRTVAKVNTAEVAFTGDNIEPGRFSHLSWPKRDQLIETENGFRIVEDGETAAEYRWGH